MQHAEIVLALLLPADEDPAEAVEPTVRSFDDPASGSVAHLSRQQLGLFTAEALQLGSWIVPSVLIGIPVGAYAIRRMDAETFRRICMSFDVWVVGFGLSRSLIALKVATGPLAYSAMLVAILLDLWLLLAFFRARRSALVAA